MIEIIDSPDKKKWDEFVCNHRLGNIFQTCIITEVYRNTHNYEPISLAAINSNNGDLLAVLHAVVIREISGWMGTFTARSVIQGGPVFVRSNDGLKAVTKLIEYYDAIVKQKAIYTQIRNICGIKAINETLESFEYIYEEHLNYLINLNRNADEIWGDIHKSRRKGINRAKKNGIVIKKIETLRELNECYYLIKETYKQVKMPLVDITLFHTAYNLLSPINIADFYLAIKEGEIVGTRIVLKYNGIVHDWYAGSKKDIYYVDEALVWHILKENAEKQEVFDFGGAGHPEKPYGVREFKRRFGGNEVNYGRYMKVHNLLKDKIIKTAFKAYKRL